MNKRVVGMLVSIATLVVPLAVVGAAPADAGCEGYINKQWARTGFRSQPAAWHFYADNRGNSEPVTITVQKSVSRTEDEGHTYSGEVSTSVKTGLKFLAEGKVDAKFGAERSTHHSYTGVTTVGWELKIPAYTEGAWDYGIYTVTAFKSRVYRDYQCQSHTVYRAKRTWPVYAGWDYDKLAYHK